MTVAQADRLYWSEYSILELDALDTPVGDLAAYARRVGRPPSRLEIESRVDRTVTRVEGRVA